MLAILYLKGEERLVMLSDRRFYRCQIADDIVNKDFIPFPKDGYYVVAVINTYGNKEAVVSIIKYLGDIEKDEVKFILSISELNLGTQRQVIEILKKFVPDKISKEKYERIKNILQCLAIEDYGKLIEKTLVKSPPEYDEMLEIFKIDYQKILKLYDEIYDRT